MDQRSLSVARLRVALAIPSFLFCAATSIGCATSDTTRDTGLLCSAEGERCDTPGACCAGLECLPGRRCGMVGRADTGGLDVGAVDAGELDAPAPIDAPAATDAPVSPPDAPGSDAAMAADASYDAAGCVDRGMDCTTAVCCAGLTCRTGNSGTTCR